MDKYFLEYQLFPFLEQKDLKKMRQCCKLFNKIIENMDYLWLMKKSTMDVLIKKKFISMI